jgi:hypothetical protein
MILLQGRNLDQLNLSQHFSAQTHISLVEDPKITPATIFNTVRRLCPSETCLILCGSRNQRRDVLAKLERKATVYKVGDLVLVSAEVSRRRGCAVQPLVGRIIKLQRDRLHPTTIAPARHAKSVAEVEWLGPMPEARTGGIQVCSEILEHAVVDFPTRTLAQYVDTVILDLEDTIEWHYLSLYRAVACARRRVVFRGSRAVLNKIIQKADLYPRRCYGD